MASEIKSKSVVVKSICSKTLRQTFAKRCKALNVSVSQRLRDLMQQDVHAVTKKKKK